MRIAIVANGPSLLSLKRADISKVADKIICVNSAIQLIPDAHAWFTLDPSESNMKIMNHPRHGVQYFAARAEGQMHFPAHVVPLERIASWQPETEPYWIRRWSCTLGLQEDKRKISTGNSAYGALNLAYHWRPEKIYLIGVDGTNQTRATGGMPNDLSHLDYLFASSVPQLAANNIEVVNLSPYSTVNCFRKSTLKAEIHKNTEHLKV